ncbi:MAG: hypothetical protein QOK40_181 [Miltoncostaeaceae bacterium]|nr:hypothetical protein [Miltoncostaeaceae bacterium]
MLVAIDLAVTVQRAPSTRQRRRTSRGAGLTTALPLPPDDAALRRLTALTRAEAGELEPGSWVRQRLEANAATPDWPERMLPELVGMRGAERQDPDRLWPEWGPSMLSDDEEAALRRLGRAMRAEAAELVRQDSAVGVRLEGWGIRLLLEAGGS